MKNILKIVFFCILAAFFLNSCGGIQKAAKKIPGGDASKVPADPAERVKKNLEEGRGFRIMDLADKKPKGGVFDFASSNELWRASLDVIDFMPLSSVNYSGGIIISDWYSSEQNSNESIKVSIRFLTNEIRSDALDIKVFNRKCLKSLINCKITSSEGVVVKELKKEILKKASIYKKENKEKKKN
tara:strand:+ start:218 stop:772 length:555 start_codon:yes stop_codon:yes gene_type:complete